MKILTLLLTMATAACAHGARAPEPPPTSQVEPYLTAAAEAARDGCSTQAPAAVASSALVDSAALIATVDSAGWLRDGGYVVTTLAFGERGLPRPVRLLETNRDSRSAGLVVKRIGQKLLRQPGGDAGRLVVWGTTTGGTRLILEPIVRCPALIQDRDVVRRIVATVGAAPALEHDTVAIEVHVDEEGFVTERTLVRPSDDRVRNALVMGMIGSMRYRPASIEREAIPSRVTFEVVF